MNLITEDELKALEEKTSESIAGYKETTPAGHIKMCQDWLQIEPYTLESLIHTIRVQQRALEMASNDAGICSTQCFSVEPTGISGYLAQAQSELEGE